MARKAKPKKSHPLLERTLPALQGAGEARARAMFGGFGIYLDDVIVGLVVRCRRGRHQIKKTSYPPNGACEDRLFFRVDHRNRPDYIHAGSTPFSYEGRGGKPVEMPYWEVPGDVQAEPDRLCDWASKARSASVAARAARRR